MPNTRQCSNCKTPTMKPVSRKLQIYNSVIRYKCSNCSANIELTPLASIGIQLTVGLLVLGFWGMILFSGAGQAGTISLLFYAGAWLLLFGITIIPALKHMQYPNSNISNSQSPFEATSNPHLLSRAILWIDKQGFVAGMLAPIIFIALILGIAALIGYISFTYFE